MTPPSECLEITDKLDHTFNLVKTKQGYRIQSRCSYPDTKRPKALKEAIESNYMKLENIDTAIRSHYFDEGCKHENISICYSFILHRIIEITGYQPRTSL